MFSSYSFKFRIHTLLNIWTSVRQNTWLVWSPSPSYHPYIYTCTWDPQYMGTLSSVHPSYAATMLENKLFINPFNLPFTTGHPSYTARFAIPQGWPHKRETTVNYTSVIGLSMGTEQTGPSRTCKSLLLEVVIHISKICKE